MELPTKSLKFHKIHPRGVLNIPQHLYSHSFFSPTLHPCINGGEIWGQLLC